MCRRITCALILALFAAVCCFPSTSAHVATVVQDGASLSFSPSAIIAGVPTTISIGLSDPTGKPITALDTVHERKLHVFIIGSDLQTFAHMHPEDFSDGFAQESRGIYTVHYAFPKAGVYALLADYTVDGVNTIAEMGVVVNGSASLPDPVYDFNTTKQFGAYTVSIVVPSRIESGSESAFDYHIERGGVNVSDLGMYLGSEIHLVVIRDDLQYPGHTHSYIPGHSMLAGAMPQFYVGPNIPIRYTFPEPGTYVLFGQFLENGTPTTTRFMIDVMPPNNQTFEQYGAAKRISVFLAQSNEIIIVVIGIIIVFPLLIWLDRRKKK